jgi:hypothetical protein
MLMFALLASVPAQGPALDPKITPSPLGESRTAFPELKSPTLPTGDKRDYDRYRKECAAFRIRVRQHLVPDEPKNASLLWKVQAEQVREGVEFYRKIQNLTELGRWDEGWRDSHLMILSDLYVVAAELQPTAAARVRCYELRILALKDFEYFTTIRVQLSGGTLPSARNEASYHRLQAEAELLRIKNVVPAQRPNIGSSKELPKEPAKLDNDPTAFPDLKLPTAPKDTQKDRERYRKELAALTAEGLWAKLPENATPVQKVQFQQVRDGLKYFEQAQLLIEFGRWDSQYNGTYLKMTDVYRVAAELQTTPANQVKCHESRILLLKDIERFVKVRVAEGNDPPHNLNLVRFYRLQAEADLEPLTVPCTAG